MNYIEDIGGSVNPTFAYVGVVESREVVLPSAFAEATADKQREVPV